MSQKIRNLKICVVVAITFSALITISQQDARAIAACEIDMPVEVKQRADYLHQLTVLHSEWLALDGMMPEFNTIRIDDPTHPVSTVSAYATCDLIREIVKWNPDCVFLINVSWLGSDYTNSQYCQPRQ